MHPFLLPIATSATYRFLKCRPSPTLPRSSSLPSLSDILLRSIKRKRVLKYSTTLQHWTSYSRGEHEYSKHIKASGLPSFVFPLSSYFRAFYLPRSLAPPLFPGQVPFHFFAAGLFIHDLLFFILRPSSILVIPVLGISSHTLCRTFIPSSKRHVLLQIIHRSRLSRLLSCGA